MIRIIANQRLDVKWIDRMWVRGRLGSTALNVAGVARHLALTWTEQPTELDPTYLHKHLTPLTHQYQSWKCSRATPLNTVGNLSQLWRWADASHILHPICAGIFVLNLFPVNVFVFVQNLFVFVQKQLTKREYPEWVMLLLTYLAPIQKLRCGHFRIMSFFNVCFFRRILSLKTALHSMHLRSLLLAFVKKIIGPSLLNCEVKVAIFDHSCCR